MRVRIRSAMMLSLATMLLSACAVQPGMPPASETQDAASARHYQPSEVYRIGPEDVLQISVWRNPELSTEAPVRPDGKISVPLIGDVQAGGLTAEQVAQNIEQGLSKYIRDPNVAVILRELHSHQFLSRVRVSGAVEQPVSMPYRQGMTVLDAVLEAGGINEFAAPNNTKVYRKTSEGTKIIDVNLRDILQGGDLSTNVDLMRGDVVTVPERLF